MCLAHGPAPSFLPKPAATPCDSHCLSPNISPSPTQESQTAAHTLARLALLYFRPALFQDRRTAALPCYLYPEPTTQGLGKFSRPGPCDALGRTVWYRKVREGRTKRCCLTTIPWDFLVRLMGIEKEPVGNRVPGPAHLLDLAVWKGADLTTA